MRPASPPQGRHEPAGEADGDAEAPGSEEGESRRGIASRRHARRRRQLARLTAERMEREQITREYAVLLQAAAARLASGQAAQEDALTEQMAALLAETRAEGAGGTTCAPSSRRSPRVSRSEADGECTSPQTRTPRTSHGGGGGGRQPRAPTISIAAAAQQAAAAAAGDAALTPAENRKVILQALRLALGRALHRDAAADSAAAEAAAAGDTSSGSEAGDCGCDRGGGSDDGDDADAAAGGAAALVNADALRPRADNMSAVLAQLEGWMRQQAVREAALASLAEEEALQRSRADFAVAAAAAASVRDSRGGVASDATAGCGCSSSAWLRRAPGVKLARRMQAALATATAAVDGGSVSDAPLCIAAVECTRFHIVFACAAAAAVMGLPAAQLVGWSEGASLHPDDSRDLATMVTRLPDFVPPVGRSPPWDVLRRRHANGRWARTRRLCGLLALVGPDDGGDPRTGGTLVGIQIETPLPPAGAADPVSAARRSALAAAAFSACEVLVVELQREWEEAPPAGGAQLGAEDGPGAAADDALGAPASGGPPSRGSSGGTLGGREGVRDTVSWVNDVILGGARALAAAQQEAGPDAAAPSKAA